MPVNYLVIEALQRLAHYHGESLTVECPTGSGKYLTLWQVAAELSRRLIALFTADPEGHRPANAPPPPAPGEPHFREHITFYEYFHGDTGEGLGARTQTGWTALVAKLLEQSRLLAELTPRAVLAPPATSPPPPSTPATTTSPPPQERGRAESAARSP